MYTDVMTEDAPRPTIKGIFVKSHVRNLEREHGREAVQEIEKRLGHSVQYSNIEDVPIRDEVRLLEAVVDYVHDGSLVDAERACEAGRLHFRNFATTPLWTLIEQMFGFNTKSILMHSSRISGYVFQDVRFTSEDLGERAVKISMYNNDYPIEHFQGFFEAWLKQADLQGSVDAIARDGYEYTIRWD